MGTALVGGRICKYARCSLLVNNAQALLGGMLQLVGSARCTPPAPAPPLMTPAPPYDACCQHGPSCSAHCAVFAYVPQLCHVS